MAEWNTIEMSVELPRSAHKLFPDFDDFFKYFRWFRWQICGDFPKSFNVFKRFGIWDAGINFGCFFDPR